MVSAGSAQGRLASTLNAAYGAGLLSESTLTYRLDLLFCGRLVEPARLVGDITGRADRRLPGASLAAALRASLRSVLSSVGACDGEVALLLALDWHGGRDELVIGRHPNCDVVLPLACVSRRHALLKFRDGAWIVQDLDSRNGTLLNGHAVKRCDLRPGDVLAVGGRQIRLD